MVSISFLSVDVLITQVLIISLDFRVQNCSFTHRGVVDCYQLKKKGGSYCKGNMRSSRIEREKNVTEIIISQKRDDYAGGFLFFKLYFVKYTL